MSVFRMTEAGRVTADVPGMVMRSTSLSEDVGLGGSGGVLKANIGEVVLSSGSLLGLIT